MSVATKPSHTPGRPALSIEPDSLIGLDGETGPVQAIRTFAASRSSAVGQITRGTFRIRSLEQAENLATLLASQYPSPERVSAGIWELLSNAIEHGNLGISFDEKSALLKCGCFLHEVERRLQLEAYSQTTATVTFQRLKKAIRLTIDDDGKGFDFAHYIAADFANQQPNGRGISIAVRFSFDRVTYIGCGNRVIATVRT